MQRDRDRSGIELNITSDYGITTAAVAQTVRVGEVVMSSVQCLIDSVQLLYWTALVSRSAFQHPTASYFYFRHLVSIDVVLFLNNVNNNNLTRTPN